jgi:2-oxoglutarate ferredoxin oxidoreductase subunit gamma
VIPVKTDADNNKSAVQDSRAATETAIKLCGFGGQGIILSGLMIGKAAAIYDGMQATFTQSYGPEARGGECSASVIVSENRAEYPFVNEADILVALSQVAYNKYVKQLKPEGLLVLDSDLVEPQNAPEGATIRGVPATAFAEQLGNKIVANVVMLGFFTAVSGKVSRKSMEKVISETVPKRFIELNMKAFAKGYDHSASEESYRK